jgi:16S rRNA (adenine1518-N6/adenine1519-N6)-dimethyltransferase
METVTAAAFGQRRKMLRASLKSLNLDLATLEIEPTARAEELSIMDFCHLAKALVDSRA